MNLSSVLAPSDYLWKTDFINYIHWKTKLTWKTYPWWENTLLVKNMQRALSTVPYEHYYGQGPVAVFGNVNQV